MKKDRGFTLIELLIVVAIIGIIAAIAIPNLLNAIDRGKQKRTMADMRSVGTAVESYSVDFNFYPIYGPGPVDGTNAGMDIEPTYIKKTPTKDGWAGVMQYECADGSEYTIQSYAKGNTNDGLVGTGGPTQTFDADIFFSNGVFVQWPEGQQR